MATPGYKTSEGLLSGGALLAIVGCVQSLDGWQRVAALGIGGAVVCVYALSRAMVKRGGEAVPALLSVGEPGAKLPIDDVTP